MKKLFSVFIFLILLGLSTDLFAADKVRIVTTTSTIADLVREVAGDRAEIYYVASPKRDVHFVAPTPKDVLKVKKAQIFVHGGLDLEAWRDPLLNAAGNPDFLGDAKASIDVSKGISLLEVPVSVSRAQGDIHLYGNPHYWVDPENAKIMVNNIVQGLSEILPEDRKTFEQNADDFNRRLDQKLKDWLTRMLSYRGTAVVVYHRSWPYFFNRFGLAEAGELEPKPGIPPTAKHMAELIKTMKEKNVKVIIKESFQENRTPTKIAEATGAKVVTLAQAVGENEKAKDYISMINYNVDQLASAFIQGSS